jgi:ADP-heptose:LPS heptosyltransferase
MSLPTAAATSGAGKRRGPTILIYRFGQLGDTLIALPALWAVRRAFPDATLTYLASEHPGSGYVAARSVLPAAGLIDDWLTYAGEGAGRVRGLFRLWKALRQRRFDILVYLVPRGRTRRAVWRDLLFFRLAGIRRVVGHQGLTPVPARIPGQPLPVVEHEADYLLQRLAQSGLPLPSRTADDLGLALTPQEHQAAEEWLRAHVRGYPDAGPLVGIGPGSKAPSNIWPEERFAALGHRLIRELHLVPVVFGGPEDRPVAERLLRQWGCGSSAAGALAIRPAAAVLARCRLYVGNDTGTMHLAAAVGTRCVAVFSAQDWPGRWNPYGPGHAVLRRQVPCEGCRLKVCTTEGLRCLTEISIEDVLSGCRAVLQGERTSRNATQ